MSSPSLAEIRRDIAGSAAFRLTLRFAAIFVACLLVLDVVFGMTARWVIEHEARAEVEELLDELREAYDEGGAGAIAGLIADEAEDMQEDGLAAGLLSADGVLLAGGLALPRPELGWSVFTPEGIDDDEALWVRSLRLPDGNWLSAGVSSETYHDVSELMLAGAAWAVAIGLPLALLSGALLSRAVFRRLAPIADTAAGVRDGELSRRAPLAGTGDEFDRLAGDINAMLDTIEALTRNLRNVSVGIAHELRTPLARIRNRLVEVTGGRRRRARVGIDAALTEIDGALATFDALLKIGQIEANAQRQGFENVRLSDLVAELAEVYEPVAAEHGKQLEARVAPDIQLRGDRALLAQMISNLLENAIEHTPEGTHISLELDSGERGRRLVVADDGPGIPAEERTRVFERFYRLDRSRGKPGNGLGLSLVKSICSLHGFTVSLAAGQVGARFEIAL
jgi:signal transduction histidine kinase